MKPLFADWEISKMILLLLGCFAFGALMFFVLTLFIAPNKQQSQSSNEIIVTPAQVAEKKVNIMDSLTKSQTETPASTSAKAFANLPASKTVVSPTQADTSDPNAGHKLDILNALNTH